LNDYWIKALGMGRRGQQIDDHWEDVANGLFRNAVTFASRPGIKSGDGIVLYASGTGLFFAVGEVTSYPYLYETDGSTNWPWRVNVKLHHWRDYIHDGEPLERLNVNGRDLRVSMRRRSHIRLSEKEYEAAKMALGL
jgi:EVE domain